MNENIKRLVEVAGNPRASMDAYIAQGKKVAGCIPEYCPDVLIHAAGVIPFGLWGAEVNIMEADRFMPTFACSIMRSCVELALTGKYDGLSFVIAPILCDALKGCSQTLRTAVTAFPTLPFALPQNRALPSAESFTAGEFNALRDKIGKVLGMEISNEAVNASIEVYNAHKRVMREFAALAAEHTDVIPATVRQAVFKSAWFMEKGEHAAIVSAINEELKALPACRKNRARVVFSGVTAGSMELMGILEEEGIDLVADWVYQDSYNYDVDIPDGPCPMCRLAKHWMSIGGSCFAHEEKRSRGAKIKELAKAYDADAVILSVMKFCDPEEYEVPQLMAEIREEYPVIAIDIDQNGDNAEQLRTRIQSFMEML